MPTDEEKEDQGRTVKTWMVLASRSSEQEGKGSRLRGEPEVHCLALIALLGPRERLRVRG